MFKKAPRRPQADDVLFTYQFVSKQEVRAATRVIYSVIESVQVVDPYTVKINFENRNPA